MTSYIWKNKLFAKNKIINSLLKMYPKLERLNKKSGVLMCDDFFVIVEDKYTSLKLYNIAFNVEDIRKVVKEGKYV